MAETANYRLSGLSCASNSLACVVEFSLVEHLVYCFVACNVRTDAESTDPQSSVFSVEGPMKRFQEPLRRSELAAMESLFATGISQNADSMITNPANTEQRFY